MIPMDTNVVFRSKAGDVIAVGYSKEADSWSR